MKIVTGVTVTGVNVRVTPVKISNTVATIYHINLIQIYSLVILHKLALRFCDSNFSLSLSILLWSGMAKLCS